MYALLGVYDYAEQDILIDALSKQYDILNTYVFNTCQLGLKYVLKNRLKNENCWTLKIRCL